MIKIEDFKTESKNKVFTFVWTFLKKQKFLFFITAIFCSLGTNLSVVGGQYFLKIIIDNLSNGYTKNIILFIFLFVIFNYFDIIADIITIKTYFNLEKNIHIDIRNTIFQYVMKYNIKFFNDNFIGSITAKINDLAEGNADMIDNILDLFGYITLFLSVMIIFMMENLYLFTIVLFLLVVYSVFFIFLSKKLKNSLEDCCEKESVFFGNIIDCLNSILLVKSFSNERYEKYKNKKFLLNNFIYWSKHEYFRACLKFLNFVSYSIIMFSVSFIGIKMFLNNKITLGTLNLLIMTSSKFINKIRHLFDGTAKCFESYGKIEQALNTLIIENKVINFSENNLVVNEGKIDIKNIYFKYIDEKPYIFNNFSLTIPGNQKLGIVGYSGAGKTTLINLLLRFYDVNEGGIYIDNQNIKTDITQESLHKNISYISQDPILFNRTIRENILYGDLKATEEEIIEATKKANCYDFIVNLQEGFNSLVGEKGIKLSGGQKQRISIARAILKKSKILIMDEATSALDSITEYEVQSALNNLMKNKTVIVIAHRLSTLNIMDRIVVIDKGQIKEDGTKEELLNKKDGLFKRMWNMQKEGVIDDRENSIKENF